MGQVLGRMAPSWMAPDNAAPSPDEVDECGGRVFTPAKGVHKIALQDNEEVVIRDSLVVRAVNGAPPEPLLLSPEAPTFDLVAETELVATALPQVTRSKRVIDDVSPSSDEGSSPDTPDGEFVARETKRHASSDIRFAEEPFQPTLIKSRECYPFLDDAETADYLSTSRVMFVLRGVPGSGKSHLAARIRDRFPEAVICSADDYFIKNGSYQYDRAQIQAAHEWCAQRLQTACEEERPHIVVDNTHVRDWEWRGCVQLAAQRHYLLLLVEPDTAWKRDPRQLALRNIHNVPEEQIRRKLKALKPCVPLYFAWMLNAADCRLLCHKAQLIVSKLFHKHPQFADEFFSMTNGGSIEELFSLYRPPAELLHCTARFCARGKVPGSRQYAERAEVARALGRQGVVRVTGLLLTPRTLGARLTLDDAQLQVWDQPDYKHSPVKSGHGAHSGRHSGHGDEGRHRHHVRHANGTHGRHGHHNQHADTHGHHNQHADTHGHNHHRKGDGDGAHGQNGTDHAGQDPTPGAQTGGSAPSLTPPSESHHHGAGSTGGFPWRAGGCEPSLAVAGGKRPLRVTAGRRAHITLACRPGQPPVVTGNDLMAVLDEMEARPELMASPAAREGRVTLHRVRQHEWYLDLERDIVVDTVFSARY